MFARSSYILGDSFYNTRKKSNNQITYTFLFYKKFHMFWWSCFFATLHFTCYFSYRCVIFTYFHAQVSMLYACLVHIMCRQTSFSHTFRKHKQARLTCINRCKDLSSNPINNNLIVLNWIGNARPCMLSDWFKKFQTKDINIDEPYTTTEYV